MLCPVFLLQHMLLHLEYPKYYVLHLWLGRLSFSIKNLLTWKRLFFFSSLFLLSLEIHAFKASEYTVSITSLICCNISFSALSKCNLVPLRITQNAATKIILLIHLSDDVSTVPAVPHQANRYSTFHFIDIWSQMQELYAFSSACMYH